MSILEFKDFTAYYPLKKKKMLRVLKNINLEVESGELLVLMGPSGCGKTTLIKSVLSDMYLTEGEVLLDGVDIDKMKKGERNIAYISQENNVFPKMTVFDNIAFPLRMMKTPDGEVTRRVKEFAEIVGVTDLLTRIPRQLSGGQIQRVEIARALIKNPRIVLFDEPFANLDATLKQSMREFVKKMHKEYKPTFLFATHDLTDAYQLADRVVLMNEGRIVETGTLAQLTSAPKEDFTRKFLGL